MRKLRRLGLVLRLIETFEKQLSVVSRQLSLMTDPNAESC
jgi:hypothetical protein